MFKFWNIHHAHTNTPLPFFPSVLYVYQNSCPTKNGPFHFVLFWQSHSSGFHQQCLGLRSWKYIDGCLSGRNISKYCWFVSLSHTKVIQRAANPLGHNSWSVLNLRLLSLTDSFQFLPFPQALRQCNIIEGCPQWEQTERVHNALLHRIRLGT